MGLFNSKEQKEKIKEMKKNKIPFCPKCKSQSVQYVERRKLLSASRAVVGAVAFSVPGAVVGAVTSSKRKGRMKCLNCGKEWKL
ncbi:hypothetical protein [Peptostreptococcus stomatis]|uniref:hypothetical protein n=1 Tax=Peptostreptococcus stomatis TaxID=341694 RepID=UPI0028ED9155|nr:hypothetical protein [Peptostreptococcus stomatis]